MQVQPQPHQEGGTISRSKLLAENDLPIDEGLIFPLTPQEKQYKA
jgi:hypothetical protein